MEKINKRTIYNFREDFKSGLWAIGCFMLLACLVVGYLWAVDRIDRHVEDSTVIAIRRDIPNGQTLVLETSDGNIWEYDVDLDTNVDIGDVAKCEFKEYEDDNRKNDTIEKLEIVAE